MNRAWAAVLLPAALCACVATGETARDPFFTDIPAGTSFAAELAVTRLSTSSVALGTRLTNTLPQALCITDLSADAFFASGRPADLVFTGLAESHLGPLRGDLRLEPGRAIEVRFTAQLLRPEEVSFRITGATPDQEARYEAAVRREMPLGAYVFEVSVTYTYCEGTGVGPGARPAPSITVSLGRSEIIRLR